MPQTMQGLMQQYVSNVRAIYGSHLRQIILYGSYARGDSVKNKFFTRQICALRQGAKAPNKFACYEKGMVINMDHGMAIKHFQQTSKRERN